MIRIHDKKKDLHKRWCPFSYEEFITRACSNCSGRIAGVWKTPCADEREIFKTVAVRDAGEAIGQHLSRVTTG